MIDYLFTFLLAVINVGLWTMRVAVTARGLRIAGSIVATLEAVAFVLAFSHVLGSLDSPGRIVVYGLGVGVGTYAGLSMDGRIREGRRSHPHTDLKAEGEDAKIRQRRRVRSLSTTGKENACLQHPNL